MVHLVDLEMERAVFVSMDYYGVHVEIRVWPHFSCMISTMALLILVSSFFHYYANLWMASISLNGKRRGLSALKSNGIQY